MSWWILGLVAWANEPEPADDAPPEKTLAPEVDEASSDAPEEGKTLSPTPDEEAEEAEDVEAAEEAVDVGAPEVIEIPAYQLGGGLEGFEAEAEAYAAKGEGAELERLVDWAGPPVMLRGRWYVRPILAWTQLQGLQSGSAGVRLGAAAGRQWFTTGDRAVQGGAAFDVRLTAPLGGVTGYRVHTALTAGPWLGPVGLRVGPTARVERSTWASGTLVLDSAVQVGGKATLALDLGRLKPYAEVEPVWDVTGVRPEASAVTATLPVIGTDTTWRAGLGWHTGWVVWSAHGAWRETALGRMLDIGIGIHLRPGGGGGGDREGRKQ